MDSKHFFDSIYDKLVLRDLVGKVVPGSILILSAGVSVYSPTEFNELLESVHWSLLVVGGGAAWLMGFALQYAGEICRLLRTHPGGRTSSRTEFFESWSKFQVTATAHEKIHAERLNVIKEACGNGAVALLVGTFMVTVGHIVRGAYEVIPMCMLLTMAVLAGLALWRMHIIHVERYGTFVGNVLRLAGVSNAGEVAGTDNPATPGGPAPSQGGSAGR
jgi:hypothetical protein